MKLLQHLRRSLQRLSDRHPVCPYCGSAVVTLKLTEWTIGAHVENAGRTSFRRLCEACGHEWQQNT